MRKSTFFFLYSGLMLLLLMLSAVDVGIRGDVQADRLKLMRQQVAGLELTDLSLFTEARYTRHLTQADLHTAFQDHPFALEHFPSGSLVPPPAILQPDFIEPSARKP
jgi:hypothetical protein